MRILFIEDNADICANVDAFFSGRGWQLDFASDGLSGLSLSLSNKYDIIVLDISMPRLDGLELCRRFRDSNDMLTPIIMLTARDTLDDKIKGFSAGADDYLVKPFAMRELGMRIESLGRRPVLRVERSKEIGNIVINKNTFEVSIANNEHTFRRLEHKILWLLSDAYPQKVNQAELCFQLWGDNVLANNSLRTHIYNVRQALSTYNASHSILFMRPDLYFLSQKLED